MRRGGGDDGTGRGWRGAELFGLRRNRRALSIACLLQGLQQLCGFVSVLNPPYKLSVPLLLSEAVWCGVVRCGPGATWLIHWAELAHVLLGHHLRPPRLPRPDADVPLRGGHQLLVHAGG